jgi:hypothetical protein
MAENAGCKPNLLKPRLDPVDLVGAIDMAGPRSRVSAHQRF